VTASHEPTRGGPTLPGRLRVGSSTTSVSARRPSTSRASCRLPSDRGPRPEAHGLRPRRGLGSLDRRGVPVCVGSLHLLTSSPLRWPSLAFGRPILGLQRSCGDRLRVLGPEEFRAPLLD